MKSGQPRLITRLFLFVLLFFCNTAFASHIVGLELYYTYISGNDYTVTLVAYGDCGPASATVFATLPTSTPTICIYDGGTLVNSIVLAVQAPSTGIEVTPVCPKDVLNTQCTDITKPYPGIKKFVYSGVFTMPYQSATWRFVFEGSMGGTGTFAGRAAAITNIISGTDTHLEDTLDNTIFNNSNPIMTTVPTPFFCLNNSDSYNPGAVDADGDSLSFSLVDAISGSGACGTPAVPVTYNAPFSGAAPLGVTTGSFNFDQHTGQISFFPNILQRAVVVYNVDEYRRGTFVGSCQREMTFLVLPCTDIPPSGDLNGVTAGQIFTNNRMKICKNSGPFTLFINPTEPDTSNTIAVSASGLPTGSTFSVTNDSTNHPNCTFSWTSDGIAPGLYIFYLTFRDNACPLSGTQTNAYSVSILPLPVIEATGEATSCVATYATLTASSPAAASYSWQPSFNLSCPHCNNTRAPNFLSAVYSVTVIDTNGCINTDSTSIRLTSPPLMHMLYNVTADQAVEYGKSVQLSVQGAWLYYWKPNDGSLNNPNINNPIATPLEKTTYTVYAYNQGGCYDTAQVTIDVITSNEIIPSAFTPNGDGLNDVFRVENLKYGHLLEMNIYNRWGQRICHTIDNSKGWDGTFEGTPQDPGVYNYYIIVERENHEKVYYKGDVTLVR
jgi:gliding motility-associated-like protein